MSLAPGRFVRESSVPGLKSVARLLLTRLPFALVLLGALLAPTLAFAADRDRDREREPGMSPGQSSSGTSIKAISSAVVNFDALARREALGRVPEVRPLVREEEENEMGEEPGASLFAPPAGPLPYSKIPVQPNVASPAPISSFMGLDDIAMVDSSYIIIPPDVAGGVGPSKVMSAHNNNYRIFDKATGAVLSTVGTATFWASVVQASERASLTDPRVTYDPINNRWIVGMQTFTSGAGKMLIGVSQTSDPQGAWNLYNFNSAQSIDFPELGFNKNWIAMNINVGSAGICLVIDYPQARAGVGTGTLFTGTGFCSAPCVTLSATEDTLFVPTHLGSAGGTYRVDIITGTPAAPVYAVGVTQARTGGGWTQPSGNQLPQSAPNSGASVCGATPCPLETQDAQIRSAPVYRLDSTTGKAYIYYTQTIRLTTPVARNLVQWSKLTPTGGALGTPVLADGGRIDDATGANWYAYAHIAVNSVGDFIIGYSRFGSTYHPSAGYSVHMASDGLGTMRDPLTYHAGEDYYHKTFTTNTGRNRWGDFSTAQVDPSDDQSLWVVQEYAKTRTSTNDGTTGSNGSKWSNWWAKVGTVTYTITASAGANGSISPSGAVTVNSGASQAFTITASAGYHVLDVLVDGGSVGAVSSYTFTNVSANHTIAATFEANPAVVAAQSTSSVICPANPCRTLPETISRIATTPMLGFSVTIQLSANLSLCGPGITEGTYLSSAGPTTFQVIDNGGGSYTVDGAVLGLGCGPTATSGTLFNIAVTSGAAGGSGSITTTAVSLRDCSNNSIAAVPGTPGTVPIDNQAPTATLTAPNGGEFWAVGSSQTITWSATDNVGVANVDLEYSTDGGATYPNVIATGVANTGSFAWTVPGPPTSTARVRVTAHDTGCSSASDASDANFTIGQPTITASAGAGGSISPSGTVAVTYGGSQTFTITPDPCYSIADVLVDGVSVGAVSSYTFTNVVTNHTIAASFALTNYTITASASSGGSISPSGAVAVGCGADQSFAIAANSCNHIADVLVDGVSVGAVSSYTFTNVQANHTIAASFAGDTYTILASAGAGGSIAPSGAVTVNCGADQAFAITADACYSIADVLVDGASVGAVASYTFTNVQANHTIAASFSPLPSSITPVTSLAAAQLKTGNDADGTTKIKITYTPPGGASSVEVWRKSFGGYPLYDDAGGSAPPAPGAYPPAGWTLTGVAASGDYDEPPVRDYWYYVAYAKDACGNTSSVSNETGGTLDYHLGDVTDGATAGQGDNSVTTADLSLLGMHYGLAGGALAGYEYLDVGPTTDTTPNGRPTTDLATDFEDLVIFAINYTPRVSAVVKGGAKSASANVLSIQEPGSVVAGDEFDVPVGLDGAGDLQALSLTLGWNRAVVEPVGVTAGELVTSQEAVLLSPGPGRADGALLGAGAGFGQGLFAMVRFRAVASGHPAITVEQTIGRDAANQPVAITVAAPLAVASNVSITELQPVIPNPAPGHATVLYSLAKGGPVDVAIYSVDGRRVKTLVRGSQEPGRYQLQWNGTDDRGALLRSGAYFVRFEAGAVRRSRLVTLMR